MCGNRRSNIGNEFRRQEVKHETTDCSSGYITASPGFHGPIHSRSKEQLNVQLVAGTSLPSKRTGEARRLFSEDIQEKLKKDIGDALGISRDEIIIEATETRQYRLNYFDGDRERGIIHYRVSIPIEKIMAGGKLMGIQSHENTTYYTIEGSTASERLPL